MERVSREKRMTLKEVVLGQALRGFSKIEGGLISLLFFTSDGHHILIGTLNRDSRANK